MNIFDFFITKIRKIDVNDKFYVSEVVRKNDVIKRALKIVKNNSYAIILDENGYYKDEIVRNNGMYCTVKKVRIGYISVDYEEKCEDKEITSMIDYLLIGIGFDKKFGNKTIRKQSMGLGTSLTDFFLEDAPRQFDYKFIFVNSIDVLEHWGVKSEKDILDRRNFKFILIKD